ncbi:MAG TPA: glycoside hydrolase family 28 protein [Verrucomicrobiae bacterium]|jgi:polygalacturonase
MKIFFAIFVLALAGSARANGTFNVHDFGAKGDGKTLDTKAIQNALDTCSRAGGGIVEFPVGDYLCQPIVVHSKTTFQVDAGATLQATTNQAEYMKVPGDWLKAKTSGDFNPFIKGENLTDITFCGGGIIDGGGAAWWGEAEKARQIKPGYTLPRPNLIGLSGCRNLRVENITLRNSPKTHLAPTECDDVVISNVTVLAPAGAANTDGIDPGDCENVLITKCHVDTGDDNVAITAGRRLPQREFGSENTTVTDCVFLNGHGMSIGSGTSGGVRNVTVDHCVFIGTQNGIRIKSQRGHGGVVENINFSNLSMTNVDPAITFTSYYTYNSAKDPVQKPLPQDDVAQPVTAGTPFFHDICVSNMTATCQGSAGLIMGLPERAITNVVFENVRIKAVSGLKIENAAGIHLEGLDIQTEQGKPFLVKNAQVDGLGDR